MSLFKEDSFKMDMDNLWGGGVKSRAASVLGMGRKSMSVDGGSARSSARDSALLDAPANMMASSPRLMEVMYRVRGS